MIKVQLFNSLIGTSILLESDPRGLDSLTQTVERSRENDGVIFEITLSLDWAKEAKEYIQSVYEVLGTDGEVLVNLYELNPNTRKSDLYYTGQIDLSKYKVTETLVTAPIKQIGFQDRVLNLFDVDVDLEIQISHSGVAIPATPTLDIPFHAKSILQTYHARPTDGNVFQQLSAIVHSFPLCVLSCAHARDTTIYTAIDTNDIVLDELEETFATQFGYVDNQFEFYRAKVSGVADLDIQVRLKHEIYTLQTGGIADIDIESPCINSGILGNTEVKAWYEHRDAFDVVKNISQIGSDFFSVGGCGGVDRIGLFETKAIQLPNINISVGDKFYLYVSVRVSATYRLALGGARQIEHNLSITADPTQTFIKFSSATTRPSTNHKTILLHEVFKKVAQYYTGQEDSFKSDFFGRTDSLPTYTGDGEGSLYSITNGGNLRRLLNRKMFVSLNDLYQSVNALWCMGIGFETIDGKQKLVIEKKEHFYKSDQMIIDLGVVSDISKEVSQRHYVNQIEFGYPKLDAKQANGVDEFNTKGRWVSPVIQTKNKLTLTSLLRASGYEIESMIRLGTTTADSSLDESLFITALKRAGITFETSRNEDFSSITGLFDPATSYNLKLSPSRSIRNWVQVLAAMVWPSLSSKIFRFSYGEGNFIMTSQLNSELSPINEGSNINLSGVNPIWIPEVYIFTAPLTRDHFKLIRQSPYGFIRFADVLGIEMDGFVESVTHKPEKNEGEFRLLKVFRNG